MQASDSGLWSQAAVRRPGSGIVLGRLVATALAAFLVASSGAVSADTGTPETGGPSAPAGAGRLQGASSTPSAQSSTTLVILVRHAEKAAPGDPEYADAPVDDPPLNAAGRERAAALARTMAEADVTAIYASEFARTQQTVAPLAEAVGPQVTIHPAADTAGLAERIAGHAGGTVVVAGHSNTVPAIIASLGAGAIEPIEEDWEYDNLYVVVVEASGAARVSTFKYGARSIR